MSRLLIVDDDPLNRALLEEELGDSGYRTFLAEDGDTALQILEEKNIDLVLLDIMMPRMSGLDVLAKIRESHSVADLPVIMVTAKHDSEDIVQSLNQGANDYIVKPIDFGVLQARIRTHLTMKSLSQEKDHFISIASHDLKNSLTTIIGAARVIGAMLPSNDTSLETVRGMVANIHEAAHDMHDLIVDFLDFHAVEDGRLVISQQRSLLNDIAERSFRGNIQYARDKQIELILDTRDQAIEVYADSARIKQVIDNFVTNAIKFCPTGSRVVIRTRQTDSVGCLEVSDNGPGLTQEDMSRIFVKYATLSNVPTGGEKSFGIGLSLCKQIIDLHDGEVGARNNPMRGATFWFRIPRYVG